MYPYWLLFALWALVAAQGERRDGQGAGPILFIIAAVITTLMIGLRSNVGGDWGSYLRTYETISFLQLPDALRMTDAGYAGLNWLSAQLNLGIMPVNLGCAILFVAGIARLASKQANPGLAMLVAVPYFIIVVAMGYTRQAAAIGIICFGMAEASRDRIIRATLYILAATLFHKTAIFLFPLLLVPILKKNIFLAALGVIVFLVAFRIAVSGSSDILVDNYIKGDYDSQGAAIRVSMNVLAAIVFWRYSKRLTMSDFQKSFWMSCAVVSVLSVAALFAGSATSGVDRISLYFIPLQMVAYANLPALTGAGRGSNSPIMLGIIGYSFAIQFVWLNYAENAGYWLPYSMSL